MLRRANGGLSLALGVAVVAVVSACGSSSNSTTGAPTNLSYATNPAVYTVGTAIAQNAPTSSGGPVTSYSVAPALPAGLSLSPTTGIISGTPTAIAAAATYTVTASNASGSTTASLRITVNDIAPSNLVYSDNPAVYTVGAAISANTPSSSGGAVVSYAVAPALPAGLSLDTTTGAITGTPTAVTATATYTVTATNSGGNTSVGLSITVNDLPPANLVYSTNPAVYDKLVAIPQNTPSNGGGAIISYSVSPALPAGLNLDPSTGVISGTPTAIAATATYTVTGSNGQGSTTVGVSITVNDTPPTSLAYSTNPATYTKGTAIAQNTPTSSGGAVVSYSVSPPLPAGLSLSPTSGVISGTPTVVAAAATYTVTATNSGGSTTAAVVITVNDIPPASLAYSRNPATYTKGTAITPNTPTNSGGAVVSYSVSPALPAGLSLSLTSGVISGTPTSVTPVATYTVTATNSGGVTTASLSITVNDVAPSSLVYSSNPAVYTKGTAITADTPSNSGGTVVSYAVSPNLPAGLAFSLTTGVISGTPTAVAAAANYVVTATNSGGFTTATVNITVKDIPPTNLVYSLNPAVYTKGTAITANTPTSGGGAVVTYSAPSLPAGLAINSTTGAITGTPTAVTPTTMYTVTATNSGGFTTASLSITVNDAAPTNLTYATNPATYTDGVAIPTNTPSNTGGTIVTYSAPSLPAGLSLSATTGAITGTPTVPMAATGYTITGTNTGGNTTVTVTITVNSAPPTGLTYATNPATYTVGTEIAPNTPSSGGGAVASYSASLPPGLALNTTTGVITGVPTQVGTGTYTITATNAGGSTNVGLKITVDAVSPSRFAFVVNENDNTVSEYTLNETTGNLRASGYVVTGAKPRTVAVHPNGKFVYVTNLNAATVSVYSLAADGQLTAGTPAATGSEPFTVTVEPKGRFAYVTNAGDGTISGYTINATTGALTSVGPAATAGTAPSGIVVDPSGRFAYATNQTAGGVSEYSINQTTGVLTSIGSIAAGTVPYAIAVDPSGSFVYVANQSSSNISAYTIGSTGVLTSAGAAVASASSPSSVAVTPSGKFVYVANASGNIALFSITATSGVLTAQGTTNAGQAVSVSVDPTGDFLYVNNFSQNNVQTYSINGSTGALALLQTMGARVGSTAFAIAQGTAAATYVPKFAYVVNGGGNNLSQYTINATTGVLTALTPNLTTGQGPASVAVDPLNRFAYVANQTDGTVAAYTVGASGALTEVGSAVDAGTGSISVAVDPSARFVYVANNASSDVAEFKLDQTTGALTSLGANITSGTDPFAVAIDPEGRFAYVANQGGNSVAQFSIDPVGGGLTQIATNVTVGNSPVAVAVDSTGSYLYVANEDDNTIQTLTIDPGTGALGGATPAVTVSTGTATAPHGIGVDPDGSYLYVVNNTTGQVLAFSIAAGVLTQVGMPINSGSAPRGVMVDPSGSFVYTADQGGGTASGYKINTTTGALTSTGTPAGAGSAPNGVFASGIIQ